MIGYSSAKKGYKLFSLDNGYCFFSRDVKFYETVFPFKLASKSIEFSESLESTFSHAKGSWDPFSYDELLVSENINDDQNSRESESNNQDGDSVVNQPSGATDFVIDANSPLDATIPN